jgi:putative ABC transport system permease protein
MESWLQDLRLSWRMLRKSPGFTAIAILCVALGIGANTVVYSIVEGVMLRPFPFADPDRIVALHRSRTADPGMDSFSYPDFFDLRRQATTLAPIAGQSGHSLTFDGDEPQRVDGCAVSAELFPLLGVRPARGRGFRPEDDRPGAAGVILISDALWHQRFQADPAIVGRSIQVNGEARLVVGVMPPRFQFPERIEAWVPLAPLLHGDDRGNRELDVLARLRPGVSPAMAAGELAAFARRQAALYPTIDTGWEAVLRPLRDDLVDRGTQLVIVALLGAVLFVLLIACSNVANLQLARATDRQREVALRLAFGASRRRIVRRLLTESVLLALGGGALGILLATFGLRAFVAAIPAEHAPPYWMRFSLDGPVLLATLLAALGTGVLFGLAPAATLARKDIQRVLNEGGRGAGAGRSRQRLRGALVTAQVAMALMLLVGASLFARSFLNLRRADGGFDTKPLLTLRFYMSGGTYDDDRAKTRRVEDLIHRLEALPGVASAGASNLVPLTSGGSGATVGVEGKAVAPGAEPHVAYTGVTAHYLRTLGVRLLAGRDLTGREAAELRPVAVVNSTFAAKLWPGQSAVGRRFRLSDSPHPEWITVIGVARDFKGEQLDRPMVPSAYLPYPYLATRNTGLILRTTLPPASLLATVRRQIHDSDPALAVFRVATMEELRRSGWWGERLESAMFGVFGAIALFLAAIGIYGVLSYNVSQRRREIGVRMALGARQWHVMRLVVGQALVLTLSGIAAGVVAALAVTRMLGDLLYDVSPTDPASFAGIAAFLCGVALLASAVPASRALDADPLDALRLE